MYYNFKDRQHSLDQNKKDNLDSELEVVLNKYSVQKTANLLYYPHPSTKNNNCVYIYKIVFLFCFSNLFCFLVFAVRIYTKMQM